MAMIDDKPESTPDQERAEPVRDAAGRWVPGVSGNTSGRSPKLKACRQAIEEARDPEKVKKMLRALFRRGIKGDNFASKLWLEHVVPMDDKALPDLSDAPPEVLEYLEKVLN